MRNLDHVSCGSLALRQRHLPNYSPHCLPIPDQLGSMTSCTPRHGRDRANDPWFGQFVYSRHYFTQSERSHRKLFRHPPSQTRDKRSQGVRRTHPGPRHVAAFAPHIPRLHLEWDSPPPGTSVTRRPASAPWNLSLEVEECALWVPEVPECAQERERPFVRVHDMRFARLRMQGSKSSFF